MTSLLEGEALEEEEMVELQTGFISFTFCSQQQHSCDFSHDNCIRLTAPVVVFAFRNIDGDIEEGEQNFLKRKFSLSSVKFLTEQLEAMRMSGPALLVTKEDKKVIYGHNLG